MDRVTIAGHAAVYGVVDRGGDVFCAGAFAGAGVVPLLLQHRGRPVGTIAAVREDARGLWIEGAVGDVNVARLVRAGALPGLSVGFRATAARQGAVRRITAAELVEVSLVAQPMQPGARVVVE